MSDEEKYTEREVIERERRAFIAGWKNRDTFGTLRSHETTLDKLAERIYPLPKVTRPRVVTDSYNFNRQWRVVDGKIETRVAGMSRWMEANAVDSGAPGWAPERVKLLADLLANPTEEVECE